MQTPEQIVVELLTALNGDNDYNYPYTRRQFQVLADNVEDLQKRGYVFDEEFVEEFVNSGLVREPFADLSELLDDIFNGVDENGVAFTEAQRDDDNRNPFHFNATPYAIGDPRPW